VGTQRYSFLGAFAKLRKATVSFIMSVSVISGFRRDVDEICALLGYYAALSGNPLRTFRDDIGPIFKGQDVQEEKNLDFLTLKDGTDTLSRIVGKGLPLGAA
jgi:hypothetical protein